MLQNGKEPLRMNDHVSSCFLNRLEVLFIKEPFNHQDPFLPAETPQLQRVTDIEDRETVRLSEPFHNMLQSVTVAVCLHHSPEEPAARRLPHFLAVVAQCVHMNDKLYGTRHFLNFPDLF